MNYKINRLTNYGVLVYHENSIFIKQVFKAYFKTYVDNYYYGVFNTIDELDDFDIFGVKEELLSFGIDL